MAGEKKVARDANLQAHIRADWKTVHKIWPNISNPTITSIKSNAKFRAYVLSAQNNLAAGLTKVIYDGETYDPGSNYDAVTNYRFVAPVTGYYLFTAGLGLTTTVTNEVYWLEFYVNGAVRTTTRVASTEFGSLELTLTDIIYLTANQYVEVFVNNGGGLTTVDVVANSNESFFAGHVLSI